MRPVSISDCNWPVPDETSESGRIEKCCNLGEGCWQCTTTDGVCWCYMIRFWNMWRLEQGQVRVKTDVRALERQIERGLQLSSNLGMCSSHDPLHDDYIATFQKVMGLFDDLDYGVSDEFWNGHKLHVVTKKPLRLVGLIASLPMTGPDADVPRVWCSLTTPDKAQSREYMREADTPFDMVFAMNRLNEMGWDDLGVSFGPCFGGWRDLDLTESILGELPPLKMAQFEMMNHGDHGLDVLTMDEVTALAHAFKEAQPQCEVYLKDTPFKVGRLVEVAM